MKIKKIFKNLIVVSILGSLLINMSACNVVKVEPTIFKTQYPNYKYYIQTGIPDNWSIQADPNQDYLDVKTGLLFHLYPNESSESRSPQFSVYHKKNEMIQLTLKGSMDLVRSDYEQSGREGITQTEPDNIFHRRMQYKFVKFDFQKNGETWKGEYYVITVNDGYLILNYEASAKAIEGGVSAFDKYYSLFTKLMDDFQLLGFEEDEKVG